MQQGYAPQQQPEDEVPDRTPMWVGLLVVLLLVVAGLVFLLVRNLGGDGGGGGVETVDSAPDLDVVL